MSRREIWAAVIMHLVGVGIFTVGTYVAAGFLGYPISWGVAPLIAVVLLIGLPLLLISTDFK